MSGIMSALIGTMFSKRHPELDPLGSDLRKHMIYRGMKE
jgi:hypothetical protein